MYVCMYVCMSTVYVLGCSYRFVSIFLYGHTSIWRCSCMSVRPFAYVRLHVYMPICLYVCMSAFLVAVCLTCLGLFVYFQMCVYVCVCLCVCISMGLYVYVYIYIYICLDLFLHQCLYVLVCVSMA